MAQVLSPGYTAAIYAVHGNLKPVVFEGWCSLGTIIDKVENFPGFLDGIIGPDLMDRASTCCGLRGQYSYTGTTKYARHVHLLACRDQLRASSKAMQDSMPYVNFTMQVQDSY
ncbi:hypothetical protein G4B88_020835 [Cannabis sativa]|uniref:Uncharacterized protein n=1 Tax=Cannabis sativa TaxID=3483 RepID=A0A7J6HNE0_CANSA|nr:hypothetical protein G4B88_020835 [Cannabis sativa]